MLVHDYIEKLKQDNETREINDGMFHGIAFNMNEGGETSVVSICTHEANPDKNYIRVQVLHKITSAKSNLGFLLACNSHNAVSSGPIAYIEGSSIVVSQCATVQSEKEISSVIASLLVYNKSIRRMEENK